MTFSTILFYILAAIVLYGALRTVTAKNLSTPLCIWC